MFSLQFQGLDNDSTISNSKNSIAYKNKVYYAELPWDEEKINFVPFNSSVSLHVSNMLALRLERSGLYEDYCKVIYVQKREGTVERINVSPED